MLGTGESPGSIRNQVGRSLNEMRECVAREDVLGLANHTRFLIALASPHLRNLGEEDRKALRVPSRAELLARGVEVDEALWEACMGILERLLPILAQAGMYAYVEGEVGNADDLALTGDESQGTAAQE